MNTITSRELELFKQSILSSEFLCYIKHCESVSDAQTLQKYLREEHPKANHHCLAYRIGAESVQEFASDDGEPSGTAGLPMLNVLKRQDLTQICAVVVRYFGGTKLGKKGLIDAYRDSVELALETLHIKPIEKRVRLSITYRYELTSDVQKKLHGLPIRIDEVQYKELVQQQISFPYANESSCKSGFEGLHNLGLIMSDSEYYFE
ncbi:YigZ family protein [bacterium]|nr:MAG: YigZ family protein [bacterium]